MDIVVKTGKSLLPKYLVLFQLIYICFVQLLIGAGLPSSLTLLCDVVNVLLFICLVRYFGKTMEAVDRFKPFFVLNFLFFFLGSVVALLCDGNIIQWAWSIRNFGRFVVFFTAVLVFIDKNDFKLIKKAAYVIEHISFVLCAYQFFVKKLKGDFIGGVFGTNHGVANTWLNVFLIIVFALALTDWLCSGKGGIRLMVIGLECMFIAVVGELKFFFIEMVLIAVMSFVLARKTFKSSKKMMAVVALGMVLLIISVPIMYSLFPFFRDFFNVKTVVKTASDSYTGTGDLGRTTAVIDIAGKIFGGDPFKVLFGIGLGNGEYSERQKIFQSAFYLKYKLSSYNWFTDAIVMVQNGLIGIALYVSGFFYIIWKLFMKYRDDKSNNTVITSLMIAILCLALFVYNISLNCDVAYLLYAILAIGLYDQKSFGPQGHKLSLKP